MLAVNAVAEEALHDFDGPLAQARMIYRMPQYLHFVIIVSSTGPDQRVLRKHLYWTIARGMNQLVVDDHFQASTFTMVLRGQRVGTVFFVSSEPRAKIAGLGTGYTDVILDSAGPALQADNTAVSMVSTDRLSFTYEFHGELLSLKDIFMGTLGALIHLAEQENHNFNVFVGSFPGYDAFHTYFAQSRPSTLSKPFISASLLASATYAFQRRNYHELRVTIKNNGREIAHGGYFGRPLEGGLVVSVS